MSFINRRELRIPSFLFLAALLLDHLITQWGMSHGKTEGDIVVIWLWKVVPGGPHLLVILWAMFIIGLAHSFAIIHVQIGRWLLYTALFGHLSGFLSWTPVLHAPIQSIWKTAGHSLGLVIILFCCAIGGGLCTLLLSKDK